MDAWNKGWAAADVEAYRARGIGQILSYMEDRYGNDAMEKTFSDWHHQ